MKVAAIKGKFHFRFMRAKSASGSFHIFAGFGIDADSIAVFDKKRDFNGGAGINDGVLHDVGGCVAFNGVVSFYHVEIHLEREFDADHLAV